MADDTGAPWNLPFQELGDAPDGPSLGADLAAAVHTALNTIDAKIATLNAMTHSFVSNAADETGITSGTFAAGASPTGVAFTAPASGNVLIHFSAYLLQSINAGSTILSGELKSGAVIGSGTLQGSAANFDRAIIVGKAVNSGAEALGQSTRTVLYIGLTPGATYNFRLLHAVAGGGTGQVLYREITVQPLL